MMAIQIMVMVSRPHSHVSIQMHMCVYMISMHREYPCPMRLAWTYATCFVCVCVCMCVCVYVCVWMHVCMYICMYVCTYVFVHACMHVAPSRAVAAWQSNLVRAHKPNLLACVHTSIHTCMTIIAYTQHTHKHEYMHAYKHTYMQNTYIHACIHTHTHTHIHT